MWEGRATRGAGGGAAGVRRVSSRAFLAWFTLAPRSSRSRAAFVWPLAAAMISGVLPFWSSSRRTACDDGADRSDGTRRERAERREVTITGERASPTDSVTRWS